MLEQTQGLHCHAKYHLNVLIVSASGGQKPQFWANFDILGAPVPTPFYRWRPNLVCYSRPRYTFTWEISSRSVYSVALCWPKKTNFAVFWTLACSGVANWQQSEQVQHACTTPNLPLSNGIKIVSVLQRLHGEIGSTNSDVQKRDGQTDRRQTDRQTNKQKTQRFWPHQRRLKSEPHQPWNGNRGPQGRSCTSKTVGVYRIVSPLGGAENLGGNQTAST